jgi:hypothetical protein
MKAQKLGEYKLSARIGNKKIYLAFKSINDIVHTIIAPSAVGPIVEGTGFTFYLGKTFTLVTVKVDDKKEKYLELVQPMKDEQIRLYPGNKEEFSKFITTDYHGYKF